MSTGKRTLDENIEIKTGSTNIFGMNLVPAGTPEHQMIYPPTLKDVKFADVNEVDRDATENMLLGIEYKVREKPKGKGLTKEQEEAMAMSGVVNF